MLPCIQIDCGEIAPGRGDGRISVFIKKLVVSNKLIRDVEGFGIIPGSRLLFFGAQEIIDHSGFIVHGELRKPGHHSLATPDDGFDVGPVSPGANVHQRRISTRHISFAVFPMTADTILLIDPLPAGGDFNTCRRSGLPQLKHPGHFIRIHI